MQLLCIAKATLRDGRNLGDIVGIYPDDWKFTDKEKILFSIVQIPLSKTVIQSVKPEIRQYRVEIKDSKENLILLGDDDRPEFELRYEDGTVKENYSKLIADKLATESKL
jgi:hypothetical protein